MKKHVLTPATIDGLAKGALKDPLTPGLRVEVQTSGKKAWKYERRVARSGALVRLTLGTFPRAPTHAKAQSPGNRMVPQSNCP